MKEKSQIRFSEILSRFQVFMKRYWPYIAIPVAVVGIISLILPRSLFHPFRCQSLNILVHDQASNGIFMDSQVIVMGTQADVDTVIGTPEKPGIAGVRLIPIEGCDLSYLNTREAPNPNLTEEQRKSLVIQLYEIPVDGGSTENVIAQINAARGDNEQTPEHYVFADPNYLISLSDSGSGSCGNPFSGGGSPFSGGGSPFSGGGSPYAGPGIPDKDVSSEFMRQWAFGNQGINLLSSSTLTGRGVRVGVFDTSPFRTSHSLFRRIGIALPSPLWLKTRDAFGTESIGSNHGLFVAGLIHAIAPKSKIQLIRVLNDSGCGDLWKITKALHDYISRMSAWTGNLNKVVINMSLGVHIPDQTQREANPDTDWEILDEDLHSFEKVITEAVDKGAIVIAAAGNDSPGKDSQGNIVDPMPMQIPAAYHNVIGVAASNKDGKRSCYSNIGDIAAPGGDGGEGKNKDNTPNPCVTRASTWNKDPGPNGGLKCEVMGECQYGLISLARTGRGKQIYIYWAGTSFSTPLVTGLAALAYQNESRDTVLCLIENGASVKQQGSTAPDPIMGWGIMNVTKSLSDASVLSTCRVSP